MVANTAALTGATITLDAAPVESRTLAAPTTGNTPIASAVTLFEKQGSEHPLLLAQNEGFVVQATVPATGTWAFAITAEWDEVSIY
jgi:hypothetical protein